MHFSKFVKYLKSVWIFCASLSLVSASNDLFNNNPVHRIPPEKQYVKNSYLVSAFFQHSLWNFNACSPKENIELTNNEYKGYKAKEMRMIMNEDKNRFLQDLSYYIISDIKYRLCLKYPPRNNSCEIINFVEDAAIKEHNTEICRNLYGLIYSWWYKDVFLCYCLNNEDSEQKLDLGRITSNVEILFERIFTIHPILKQYLPSQKEEFFKNESLNATLEFLKELLFRQYFRFNDHHTLNPLYTSDPCFIEYDGSEFISCNEQVNRLWKEYKQFYVDFATSISTISYCSFAEVFAELKHRADTLVNKFKTLQEEVVIQNHLSSFDKVLECSNWCISRLESILDELSRDKLKFERFLELFNTVDKILPDIFFYGLGMCRSLTFAEWKDKDCESTPFTDDAYFWEVARMIETMPGNSGDMVELLLEYLDSPCIWEPPSSLFIIHMYSYSFLLPGLVKSICDSNLRMSLEGQFEIICLKKAIFDSVFEIFENNGVPAIQNRKMWSFTINEQWLPGIHGLISSYYVVVKRKYGFLGLYDAIVAILNPFGQPHGIKTLISLYITMQRENPSMERITYYINYLIGILKEEGIRNIEDLCSFDAKNNRAVVIIYAIQILKYNKSRHLTFDEEFSDKFKQTSDFTFLLQNGVQNNGTIDYLEHQQQTFNDELYRIG